MAMPFDPRNPFPFGYQPFTPEQAAQPAPTPAAAAARLGTPGYPAQSLTNPGIYAKQQTPPGGIPGYPGQGVGGSGINLMGMGGPQMDFGGGPPMPAGPVRPGYDPNLPDMLQQMRAGPPPRGGGSITSSAPTPPPRPATPRGAPAPGGDTGPAAGVPEPAIPEGQVGPTLTAPPPKVAVPADAMAAGDPDKDDFLDMQNAIVNWQMGTGGTGQRMTDANRLQQTGEGINTRASQVKGRHPVNQAVRALGGIGQGLAAYKAGGERARIQETTDQLRNTARAELDRIRERRRGGKKPAAAAAGGSAQDNAFANFGDVSALDLDEDRFYMG